MPRPPLRRFVLWSFVIGVGVCGVLVAGTAYLLRPERMRAEVERGLSRHLNLDVSVGSLDFNFLPRPRVSGSDMVMRIPNQPDLPPFIAIDHFEVNVGLLSAFRKHVNTVHVDGLRISVPPGDARRDLTAPSSGAAIDNARNNNRSDVIVMSDVIVDHLVTHDAELTFVPRKPGKKPLSFKIHDLEVNDIGFDRPMTYEAKLTNPVPVGLVHARGTIGPWRRDDGSATPLAGEYTFTDADLSTINGIGGTLSSTGTFTGQLTAINAIGESAVPDFNLDLGGKPVALTAKFDTLIDGTDGTTILNRVDATILDTAMIVSGAITNLEGPGRHEVSLKVDIADGRIENLFALAMDTPKPVMTGDVALTATLLLPPGKPRVRDRIRLAGTFGLGRARFSDAEVQAKLTEFSRRSQGKDREDQLGRVMTSLKGRFELANALMRLSKLSFKVPGADVNLAGTYHLTSERMNFAGTLRMEATVSQAVGGLKSIFIKPFDFIFRKDGAGAVVPIKITGTRQQPKFGLQVGKVFGGG
ncbi:MAG TPA: AsmA-like C-terminal region-containing protein [Vicinamibacterales bacterium]|nr:AsmA-like C-terminal region-containing protein [Vicinamibacterales bacterium]